MDKLIFDPPLDFGMIYAARSIMENTGIMRSLSMLGKYREKESAEIIALACSPPPLIQINTLYSGVI